MKDVRAKYVPPAVDQASFNCPHCGALAHQSWFSLHADRLTQDGTPFVIAPERAKEFEREHRNNPEHHQMVAWLKRLAEGRPFIEAHDQHRNFDLENVWVARCYSCSDISFWIYNQLIWPRRGEAPLPNADLPPDVRQDYEEASTILDLSPRGAAALLRLGIQKLCAFLGEKGKSIDDDIAALVRKGLHLRVQQALDVVRVIGNNAVHPGQIDLRDDRATAEKLFGLVNLIAEAMIEQPRHIEELYKTLPEGARKAIEKRDGPKTQG